jgi:SAM-dependent methyltransferase
MGRWSRCLAPLLIEYSGVSAGGRVLDVGCGTGSLTFELARNPRIEAVQGIDLVRAYIDHAQARSCDLRVSFRVADACELPFQDGVFDHSLSLLALQFVPDADRAVAEMRRVTRPGGTVAAATWDTRGGLLLYRIFFDTAAALDPDAAKRRASACARPMATAGGLVRAWRNAGMVDVVQGSLMIRMDFTSFDDFWLPLNGQDGPYADYLRTLGTYDKTKLRGLLQAAYLDGAPDGPRSYAAIAWAVRGRVP